MSTQARASFLCCWASNMSLIWFLFGWGGKVLAVVAVMIIRNSGSSSGGSGSSNSSKSSRSSSSSSSISSRRTTTAVMPNKSNANIEIKTDKDHVNKDSFNYRKCPCCKQQE